MYKGQKSFHGGGSAVKIFLGASSMLLPACIRQVCGQKNTLRSLSITSMRKESIPLRQDVEKRMVSLIQSEQVWLIWMVVIALGAFAILAEQKFKWGGKIGSAIIAIFSALLLVNIRLIPASSSVYGVIDSYILPLSIPLLLFQCDLRKIIRESGKLCIVFFVSAVGTLVGVAVCGLVFRDVDGVSGIAAMTTGAHIGGTVNLVAMGQTFQMDANYVNACAIAANLFLAFYMLLLSSAANLKIVRKMYRTPFIDEMESSVDTGKSMAESYWKPKNISLLSLAMSLATTFVITGVSQTICTAVNGTDAPFIVKQLFGSIYLVMTLITVALVTLFPKYFEKLQGAEELGNFAIILFFVGLGCKANLAELAQIGLIVVAFIICIMVCNFFVTMIVGKIFKWSYEEISVCCNATFGGPTTAAAYAINKGWHALVVPSILVGLLGYIIGNYFGVLIGNLLM